jgi:hypothetical protein
MRNWVWAFAACVVVTGCSGRGSSLPVPTPSDSRGTLSFVKIAIANVSLSSAQRAPRYLSPSMQSLVITIDPGPGQTSLDVGLTTSSPSCTAATPTAPATCTTNSVPVTPGPHTFDFTTYDGVFDGSGNPQGHVLSQNMGFPFSVVQGVVNTLNVALQGVTAGIAVTPGAGQDVEGTQQTGFVLHGMSPRTFTAFAVDAGGNYILGTGAPTIALSSSDPSTISNGVASPNNPNLFTVTPVSYHPYSQTLFIVTATPSSATGTNSGTGAYSTGIPVLLTPSS